MEINKLIPAPEIRNWTGPFDDTEYYLNLGKEQAEKIIQWLSIKPEQKILDIGCGCGRIAIHFLNYLNEQGKYIGIDSNKLLLSYCEDNISTVNNNFQFEFVDAYNGAYSRDGKLKCQDIVFPVENESVDTVIMWSVFTHMYLADIDAYLKEIHRVLKKGGLFISSFNLYNKFIENQIKTDKAYLNINYKINEASYTLDKETPEGGFAHDEEKIKDLYWENGFFIREIKYGIWSSKELAGEFHDCIIAEKLEDCLLPK
ncbi:class I SAM-dependent methyltransferase [Clostridium manihotivorum]|nr:class I SAM-dependent methyltransferase [Clostridium manihotivorum]